MTPFFNETSELKINLTYDVPFKFMFAQQGETENLLAEFLNHVLALNNERRIIELHYQSIEVPPPFIEGRRLILDLKVTDQRGITYNVEIQRENTAAIVNRALYQYSRITGEQLRESESFDRLTSVVIILLCNYSTFPDQEAIRLFKLAPFTLNQAHSQQTLPYKTAHFDPQKALRYNDLRHRLRKVNMSIDLLHIYLVELDKDLSFLTPDQQTCLHYLTTDFRFFQENTEMNQSKPKVPQYFIHEDASEGAKRWVKEAQNRLELFANLPNQREAYERELLNLLDHNTLIKEKEEEGYRLGKVEGKAEGKAEERAKLLVYSIQGLRHSGLSDAEIIAKLNLSPKEITQYLKA